MAAGMTAEADRTDGVIRTTVGHESPFLQPGLTWFGQLPVGAGPRQWFGGRAPFSRDRATMVVVTTGMAVAILVVP
jgi:hypothetical protein